MQHKPHQRSDDPFDGIEDVAAETRRLQRQFIEEEKKKKENGSQRQKHRRKKKKKSRRGEGVVVDAPPPEEIPIIATTGRDECDVANDARMALLLAENCYIHHGALVEYRDERLALLAGPDSVRELLSRVARWRRQTKDGTQPTTIPEYVVKAVRARPPANLQEVSSLAIVEHPIVTSQGIIVVDEGYLPREKVYVRPQAIDGFVAPEKRGPTQDELLEAIGLIGELLEFPFSNPADHTHAVALLLAPLVQHLVGAPQPLFVVEAATPGTGKGKLIKAAGVIADGRPPAAHSMPEGHQGRVDELELAKQLTASAMCGERWFWIDNAKARINSGVLAKATIEGHSGRVLGRSTQIEMDASKTIFVLAGNNISMHGEMARRSLRIRLIASCERPDTRTNFKHFPLEPWVIKNRGRLFGALLTIIRHWLAEGRPLFKGGVIGSFEAWSSIVGGILQAAGYEDFLGNRGEAYEEADEEAGDWRAFFAEWWTENGENEVQASDVHRIAGQTLPSYLLGSGGEADQIGRLGRLLNKRRDRYFGDYQILRGGRSNGRRRFRLRKVVEVEAQIEVPF